MATRSLSNLWTDSVAPSSGTRAAPTAVTEGLALDGIYGFRVIVSADSGKVLKGAGSVNLWVWEPNLGTGRWAIDPDLSYTMTASGVTWVDNRDRSSSDFVVKNRVGRVVPQVVGVDVDSGGVTVQIQPFGEKL